MNLREAKKDLLTRESPCKWAKRADKYMEVYRADKRGFALPSEYASLEPIIKHYADRPKEFARFVLDMRDHHPRGSAEYADLNRFYRLVMTRAVQQERRARVDAALSKAIKEHGPPPTFSERLQWVARREADWASERLDYLSERRRKTSSGRLSREETNDLLEVFWAGIKQRIESEGLPPWGE